MSGVLVVFVGDTVVVVASSEPVVGVEVVTGIVIRFVKTVKILWLEKKNAIMTHCALTIL